MCGVKCRVADAEGNKPVNVSTNDKITSMLMKQKSQMIARKSAKVERKTAEDFYLKEAIEYKGVRIPARPPRVTGYILKIGKVLGGKNRRYFELNSIEGNLIKYMRREDYPKHPKEIYCLANILKLVRVSSSEQQKFHHVEVRCW